MIWTMYSIKNEELEEPFYNPILWENEEEAIEFLLNFLNKKEMEDRNPLEYKMYKVGEFNTATGEVTPIEPTLLIRATKVIKIGENNE